ncbi:MAG: aminopeptidase P family protein [Gammaproteobacteria bacterium]|nr:aminopeptidase P family protein [Gammaproteobacteria bacterium]NIR82026.1 aminopeptidase P family protein [Gammaproteobacteria bacterium]NIR89254.1 aminopeptidase P family protein [Gammaproteobacteria bacterium]NIU03136.1 aminopeptidase P family protein [Gammaproteobacteria bacterium]NIV50652.1 M24 family metallopeptidase [Gammaproteobacteria bacterium]
MRHLFAPRAEEFQRRMADERIDLVLLTDPDAVYYMGSYWGYLGVEFGRPTIVAIPREGQPTLITPGMEAEMARQMSWIEDVREWTDGVAGEWTTPLREVLELYRPASLGVEQYHIPGLVREFLGEEFPQVGQRDASRILGEMRMIKSPEELHIMRQAGQVAVAMAQAAEQAVGEGVPEYEVALAVLSGGTRKAAEYLSDEGIDRLVSPTIYNLQAMQSGRDTSMVHRRSTVRRLRRGDPFYLCFCGMANFNHYKLGFDREYFIGSVTDEQAQIHELALSAQAAALDTIRPGVLAEDVHAAAEAVYREAGFEPGYRTGRAIGCSFLEKPQLKNGDKTPLQAGMTFSVDGGITVAGEFGARIGDSVVVTETGFECLTPYPRGLRLL